MPWTAKQLGFFGAELARRRRGLTHRMKVKTSKLKHMVKEGKKK
jgi:hypothetical protein